MKIGLCCLVMVLVVGSARPYDLPNPGTETSAQAQARQFGIFFGGTASQYDLCVKKGFLNRGDRPAVDIAKSFLDNAMASQGADLSAYMQDGWDTMKNEILAHEEFFTKEKCASVGKEWKKIQSKMHT